MIKFKEKVLYNKITGKPILDCNELVCAHCYVLKGELERRLIRQLAVAPVNIPISVIDGEKEPIKCGESGYFTWSNNPNGTRVWSQAGRRSRRTYYWPSTRRVEIGRLTLIKLRLGFDIKSPIGIIYDYLEENGFGEWTNKIKEL